MGIDILFFLTWKTWRNRHLIDAAMADHLLAILPPLAILEKASLIEIAVVPDHVHAIVRTTVQPDLSAILQRLKGASARMVNRDTTPACPLRWATGYDARTIGRLALPTVRAYLDRQALKHGYAWQRRYSA